MWCRANNNGSSLHRPNGVRAIGKTLQKFERIPNPGTAKASAPSFTRAYLPTTTKRSLTAFAKLLTIEADPTHIYFPHTSHLSDEVRRVSLPNAGPVFFFSGARVPDRVINKYASRCCDGTEFWTPQHLSPQTQHNVAGLFLRRR